MRKGARDWRVGRFPKRLQDGSRVGSDPPFRILANGTRRVPCGAGSVPASPTAISVIYRSRGMTPPDQEMDGGLGRFRGAVPVVGTALGTAQEPPAEPPQKQLQNQPVPGVVPAPKPVGSIGGSAPGTNPGPIPPRHTAGRRRPKKRFLDAPHQARAGAGFGSAARVGSGNIGGRVGNIRSRSRVSGGSDAFTARRSKC